MGSDKLFKVTEEWEKQSLVNKEQYENLYEESIKNNESFWNLQGQRIDWFEPYTKIKKIKFSSTDVNIKWYYDGVLNASFNCIDRHAAKDPDKIAIIWEGDDPTISKKISF